MTTRYIFAMCLCTALLCLAFQAGVSAEQDIDRIGRRDPFASLLNVPKPDWKGPLPSENQETILQQYDLKQFQVIGIVLGNWGIMPLSWHLTESAI